MKDTHIRFGVVKAKEEGKMWKKKSDFYGLLKEKDNKERNFNYQKEKREELYMGILERRLDFLWQFHNQN